MDKHLASVYNVYNQLDSPVLYIVSEPPPLIPTVLTRRPCVGQGQMFSANQHTAVVIRSVHVDMSLYQPG